MSRFSDLPFDSPHNGPPDEPEEGRVSSSCFCGRFTLDGATEPQSCGDSTCKPGRTHSRIDDHLPVGTALIIGHPANGCRWFRTEQGWIDQSGRSVADDIGFYDTIGHGAYRVMTAPARVQTEEVDGPP